MPLARLQQDFLDALLADDAGSADVLSTIRGGGLSPLERLSIYRNNLRENFSKVLALEFPVTQQLVGADYFRQTAQQFLQSAPSQSGDLFHCGREFPGFLRRQFADSDFAYLPDVAALEWAVQEAIIAADDNSVVDVAGLGRLPADSYEGLHLRPHPALRVVCSRFPIVAIWNAHQSDSASQDIAPIDLAQGGENALLLRSVRSTSVATVSAGVALFLQAVIAANSLGAALEQALRQDPGFDLKAHLGPWIRDRTIVGWSSD